MPVSPEELARVVLGSVESVSHSRSLPQEDEPSSVPVRSPRPRNLARQLLEGDSLKADAKRFLARRRAGVPAGWNVEGIVEAEQALAAVGVPGGTYLGLLRFAADLQDDREIGRTSGERRWWGLLRRRLASSSGIALVRSVADGMEVVRYLMEDADTASQQGFTDLLRLVGARTGIDIIAQPRLAEKALWEFAVLLASRTRVWNRSHHASVGRLVSPLDIYLGGVMVYARDRQAEPSLAELRTSVFQTGAPLAPALDSWLRRLQEIPGSTLLKIQFPVSADPRPWVWNTGKELVADARPERLARLAACERALIDLARREDATREAAAVALERAVRDLLERELPASRMDPPKASTPVPPAAAAPSAKVATEMPRPSTIPPARPLGVELLHGVGVRDKAAPVQQAFEPATVRLPPRPSANPAPPRIQTPTKLVASPESLAPLKVPEVVATPSSPLALAMQDYETSTNLRTITLPVFEKEAFAVVAANDLVTLDALPVGFDMADLERQASQLEECLRTGLTSTGRQWIEKYRGLLGDARVREFLRFPPEWIGGLRDLLTSGDLWILAGMEDLLRYLYPSSDRPHEIEFRYNQRHGDPGPLRTGWDWTILRLVALAVAETASGQGDPEFAPTPLVTLRRWHSYSRSKDSLPHSAAWWNWLAEEVDVRAEAVYRRPFQVRAAAELSLWRERHVKPWLAIPSEASLVKLGQWARMPVHSLRQDPSPSAERWASRLSMLGQLLEEGKEDLLHDLAYGPL